MRKMYDISKQLINLNKQYDYTKMGGVSLLRSPGVNLLRSTGVTFGRSSGVCFTEFYKKASFNAAIRVEYVDWNVGAFNETGGNIADEIFAIVPALSFRTSPQTVLRLNYRYEWRKDILGNPAARTGAIQFGVSSYF